MASFRETRYGWRAEIFRRGVRRSESGFRTKAAAVAWAGKFESDVMAGVRGEVPNLTVLALLERYENEVSAGKKGERWERVRLKVLGEDKLAQVRLRQLDTPHVSDWQQRRLKEVSAASVRRERNLLNHAFNIALNEWRWLSKNPFKGVRRPKDGRPRNRIASAAEIEKLLKAASPGMKRAITIALESGMRASEIASNPQIKGRVAYLIDSKNGEAREVPLSQTAIDTWKTPILLSPGSMGAMFARLCADLDIKGLTFHDLRHTACTRLAGPKKLTLLELCRMMGWKDPRHALIYYNEGATEIAKKL